LAAVTMISTSNSKRARSVRRRAMNDLYEADVLLWSEQQAALLRRVAAGERINDQVDWENVVEEIESVGSEQLVHAVESLLMRALAHMAKAEAWPHSRDVPHRCRGPVCSVDATTARPRKDLSPGIADHSRDDRRAAPLPLLAATCRVTLDELLSED
jgi:hypothetical protein